MNEKKTDGQRELLGKKVTYRKLYEAEMKTGIVNKVEILASVRTGREEVLLHLDNGDVVDAGIAYFSTSIAG